jgi:hypothetical protein
LATIVITARGVAKQGLARVEEYAHCVYMEDASACEAADDLLTTSRPRTKGAHGRACCDAGRTHRQAIAQALSIQSWWTQRPSRYRHGSDRRSAHRSGAINSARGRGLSTCEIQ